MHFVHFLCLSHLAHLGQSDLGVYCEWCLTSKAFCVSMLKTVKQHEKLVQAKWGTLKGSASAFFV